MHHRPFSSSLFRFRVANQIRPESKHSNHHSIRIAKPQHTWFVSSNLIVMTIQNINRKKSAIHYYHSRYHDDETTSILFSFKAKNRKQEKKTYKCSNEITNFPGISNLKFKNGKKVLVNCNCNCNQNGAHLI